MSKLLCVLLITTMTSTVWAAPSKTAKSKKVKAAVNASTVTPLVVPQIFINKIEIAGNRKIEKDAILSKLVSAAGKPYSEQLIRQDVESLFKMGFFNNIEVDKQVAGNEVVLTYKVLEKPSVVEITYEGNSEIKSEDIADAAGLKTYQLLNMAKVKEAVEKVQKLYEDKGYFLAKIDVDVDVIKADETVRLVFKIKENDKVKVKKITFLGNSHLGDSLLKSKLLTQEGGFFSGLSGSGQYKQEMFERDTQILRFVYWNQGYVQARIDRPQVTVTPDRKNIYITIRIDEGDQFQVGEVDFTGDILFSKDELSEIIKIDENGVFAYDVLQRDISELTAKYGDQGYAYANVIPRTAFDTKNKKVNLLFEFDKGSKVYFGKINMVGNSKTRDKVIRRELKINEGELYNETRRRQSIENIQRLGYFEEVNFKTSIDPDHNEVMNVDVSVKERNTGQIQLGAGYGTSQGFTMQGSVNQANFLGKGQNLGASLNISNTGSYYNLSFTEPYFNDTLWSLGTDLYQSANTARVDYDEKHKGGAFRFGHPLAEYTRGFFRYKYDDTQLSTKYDLTGKVTTDTDLFPLHTASGITSSITGTLEYDSRNDRQMPTKGIFGSASYEYAGVGGSLKYTRLSGSYRFYKNVIWDLVWRNNLQYARIDSLEGRTVPFSELYLLGGPYSLRGYRSYRVGKMIKSTKIYDDLVKNQNVSPADAAIRAMRFVGGTQQALYQTELQFPLVKEAGIMGAGFFDAGAADDAITDKNFYLDVGFGIRWYSPIGVLRFEWGFPLNRNPLYHDSTVFEFSIGPSF